MGVWRFTEGSFKYWNTRVAFYPDGRFIRYDWTDGWTGYGTWVQGGNTVIARYSQLESRWEVKNTWEMTSRNSATGGMVRENPDLLWKPLDPDGVLPSFGLYSGLSSWRSSHLWPPFGPARRLR